MAKKILKGFKQVAEGSFSAETGYVYFVRDDENGGYIQLDGKKYGKASDEIFWVRSADTTYNEIVSAYTEGKLVILDEDGGVIPMAAFDEEEKVVFFTVSFDTANVAIVVDENNNWEERFTELLTEDSFKTINGENIVGEGDISIKGDEIFWVTIGETTYNEIISAYTENKLVVIDAEGGRVPLVAVDEDEEIVYFAAALETVILTITVDKENNWINDTANLEALWEKGEGENSVVLKGSNGTAFGAKSVVEGSSVTNAIERGITSESTDAEIITEWSGSTPDTDKFSLAKGEASHVEGNNGLAIGAHSHVEGNGCIAGNNSSHAEGTGSYAAGKYAHAEGLETLAEGSRSHAEGAWTKAILDESHAEGQYSEARARASHAEGYNSIASKEGYSSNTLSPHAQGTGTSSWVNACSHAEGNATIAQGLGAHAEGEKTFANERATHAEGCETVVKSEYSHAEGKNTTAGTGHDSGTAAHSEGDTTRATAWATHAEGYQTEANAWVSHSEGAKTLAGTGSQPIAYNSDSDGYFAHAEGNGTWAKGSASHAEGRHTQALKKYDHAEGWGATANGIAAHAEGEDTQANAECSHAEGWQTRTSNDCEHAEGQYNVSNTGSTSDKKTMHSVGIGTSFQRKNAFEIMQSGDAYLYGVGGYSGASITGDVKTLQEVLNNIPSKAGSAVVALDSSDAGTDVFIGPYRTNANYLFVLENIGQPISYVGVVTDGNEGGNVFDVKGNIPNEIRYDKVVCSNGDTYVRINYHNIPYYEFSTNVTVTNFLGNETKILGSATEVESQGSLISSTTPYYYASSKIGSYYLVNTTSGSYDEIDYAWTCGKFVILQDGNGKTYMPLNGSANDAPTKFFNVTEDASGVVYYNVYTVKPNNNQWTLESTAINSDACLWEEGTGANSAVLKGLSNVAIGDYSVSAGYSATTIGDASHAEGANVVAMGNVSHIEGVSATNAIDRGITTASTVSQIITEWESSSPAANKFALTFGEYSHAEGSNGLALGKNSHVEGNGSVARGHSAHAEGTGSRALGDYAHSEGLESIAYGKQAHAEGELTVASGESSHSEGKATSALTTYSHAEGYLTTASGESSHAEGRNNTAKGNRSHAEGMGTQAIGNQSHSEGNDTIARAWASHVEGYNTEVGGSYTANTKTADTDDNPGDLAHAEGNATIAKGPSSHSEGIKTFAAGKASHAEGSGTTSSGMSSHAEGGETSAIGDASHAEGGETTAHGIASHAEGGSTTAYGELSHAEGYSTTASGSGSHAEGAETFAHGDASHAEGVSTHAYVDGSHAEGSETMASGICSHVEGRGTIALNVGEHAEGQFNVSHTGATSAYNTTHSIGIGTTSSDTKNAFEVMQNGDAYLYGVGGYSGNTITSASTIQSVISELMSSVLYYENYDDNS